jgi:hypothetical protein
MIAKKVKTPPRRESAMTVSFWRLSFQALRDLISLGAVIARVLLLIDNTIPAVNFNHD